MKYIFSVIVRLGCQWDPRRSLNANSTDQKIRRGGGGVTRRGNGLISLLLRPLLEDGPEEVKPPVPDDRKDMVGRYVEV